MNQKTVKLSNVWVCLNEELGASVGAQIDVQVISGRDVRVATGDNTPDESVHGFSFQSGGFFRIEAGAKKAWVRAAYYKDAPILEAQY